MRTAMLGVMISPLAPPPLHPQHDNRSPHQYATQNERKVRGQARLRCWGSRQQESLILVQGNQARRHAYATNSKHFATHASESGVGAREGIRCSVYPPIVRRVILYRFVPAEPANK